MQGGGVGKGRGKNIEEQGRNKVETKLKCEHEVGFLFGYLLDSFFKVCFLLHLIFI
jgi:hypothetical protein